MCAPIMMIPAIISAVGAVTSGIAQSNAANYQAAVARNNQQIAQENAKRSVQAADIQATNQGLKNRGIQGGIKAAFAGNNVDVNSGSAVNVLGSQAELSALDQYTIRNRGEVEKNAYQNQAMAYGATAGLEEMQGQNAITSSLISGASSIGGGYANQQLYGSKLPNLWG